ncbi:MAG: radical SAM protein [Thermoplasmata archaeon]|nr:radical SAM protein [Thermoplasmata archaeon]
MQIFWPSQNFITVSVTGHECQLMCQHCQSRFLKHMEPANTPEKLWELASETDAKGMLISGGSDLNGAVPILPYLDIIKNIKEELNISINLHTGLITLEDISKLAGKGIDVISFDVIGSAEALKNVYGQEVEDDYFDNALAEFKKAGLKVVPHITVGLDRGNDSGEENALKIIARHGPDFVVLNALMSSEGAKKATRRLIDVLRLAREILPEKTAIGIGCMRPRGQIVDADLLMELGINTMALPSKDLIRQLRSLGVDIVEKDGCCAFFSL